MLHNLPTRRFTADEYDHQVLSRNASIAPLAFPDLVIPVRAIQG